MPSVRQLNSQVSAHVDEVIAHAMAMHPDDRPSSIPQFRAELFGKQAVQRGPGSGRISRKAGRRRLGYPLIGDTTWRDALWHNRVLLLLLGAFLALAVAVTALPAERPVTSFNPADNSAIEVNHLP